MANASSKRLVDKIFKAADIKIGGNRAWDIRVNNDKFYSRVIAGGSLALGESYTDGWWECNDLGSLFSHILQTGLRSPRIDTHAASIYIRSVLGNLQSLNGSKRVADVHYNLPSEMYALFLGPYNQYTSFYYAHTDDDLVAEEERLKLICRKLKLTKKDKVLDIGCGWGGFAKYAAENYGCQVIGVSIAKEQIAYARKTVKGLPVKFILKDYRLISGSYTKIFSGGMLEHVGYKNYRTYFKKIKSLLADDGIAVIDCIGGIRQVKGPDPWLGKYIFPNSMIATPAQLAKAFEGLFVLEDWHNFRYDYARTVDFWDRKFVKNWPMIQQLDPRLFNERFYRLWRYYLGIFIGAFYSGELQQWQVVLTKKGLAKGYDYQR